jgi:predicted GNAT superfamily acetyltransferase
MVIEIRTPASVEEYKALEWLQAEIWGTSLDIVPVPLLVTMAKEGGVVLIALDEGKPVGFAFGFPALVAGQFKLASHQAGVLQAYQDRGLGYRIKVAQREAALAKGFELITWTFDPLQGRNAAFNLRKLGAVCQTYYQNLYGDMDDELNRGLPSDRFRVDWWLASAHVSGRLEGRAPQPDLANLDYPILNAATRSKGELALPPEPITLPATPSCLVESPVDLVRLKREAPEAALLWRLQTRQIFETASNSGYTAIDLLRHKGRNYYLLQKDWALGI